MDLHKIAISLVRAVNPMQPVTLRTSNGWTLGADGKRTPTYNPDVVVSGQVQPIQYRDLAQLDGLNLNGTRRKIYLEGEVDATIRLNRKGGDLIIDANGNTWLTALVLEQWPDWVAVAVTLQNGS